MKSKYKTYRVFATKHLIDPAEFIIVAYSQVELDNQLEALSMAGYTEIVSYRLDV